MATSPDDAPFDTQDAPRKRGPSRYAIIIACLLAIPLIGVLVGLLWPATAGVREAGRRAQCLNQLRQISEAMCKYQEKYGHFPPAFIADEKGKPKHSWRVLILPFLGEDDLYKQYRFDEPWNGPHNKELASRMPAVYRCPSDPFGPDIETGALRTSYGMIVGPLAISDGPTPRKPSDVKDGLSSTVLLAECAEACINWLEPRDIDVLEMAARKPAWDWQKAYPAGISSGHPSMVNVLFCDGSVRSLRKEIEPKQLQALTTVDGGESVNMDDL